MKPHNKINKRNKHNVISLGIIIVTIAIMFLSIGFSAYQNNLAIENISASVRIDKDIRITNVNIANLNDAKTYYEEYNTSNISGNIKLNSSASYVIYEIEISNLGNTEMGITEAAINNENLQFEFLNYNLKEKICENDECSLGIKKKIQVKISYKENVNPNPNEMKFTLNFNYGQFFKISYYNIPNSETLPKEIIEHDTININISNQKENLIKIYMAGKLLQKDIDFQHINDNLTIPDVSGDVQINYKMPICQRATLLHTEECKGNICNGMGYKPGGTMGSRTITYGSLGTTGKLKSGDAFDCDVNGDGIYDPETERFYYVKDLENNDNIAVLIYYNNVSNGTPSNDTYYQYYTIAENWHGPLNAMSQLPTTTQWKNVKLTQTSRNLVNEYGTTSSKDGHSYPETLDYSNYAARLLTMAEVKKLTTAYIPSWKNGELDAHLYLVENTNFSKKDNSKFDGYWLETPRNTMSNHGWIIYATARRVHSVEVQRTDVLVGVRPVIEVSKADISY